FNLFTFGLTAHGIMLRVMNSYGIKLQPYSNDYKTLYLDNFKYDFDCLHILMLNPNDFIKSYKYIKLLPDITTIFLIRDPIKKIKTGLNHGGYKKKCKSYDIIDSIVPISKILDRVEYPYHKNLTIGHMLNFWLNNGVWYYDSIVKNIKSEIYYLDVEKLMPNNILELLNVLKLRFNLKEIKNTEILQKIVVGKYRYILPIIISFSFNCMEIKVYIELKDRITSNNINLDKIINLDHKLLQDISFSVNKSDFVKLNNVFLEKIQKFQEVFLDILEQKIIELEGKKWTEKDILDELKNNKTAREKLYRILYKELDHIKQHRPDIVASWKYYQEFEKICEELDKKE
ncbi:TPA: DUF2972 domain-containing protein, partial [Campylobacter coli]|nr:DUF2972 domain-containing protein [Campylobacter coli]